jgi:hypothetical protein
MLVHRAVSHYGYTVASIPEAVRYWSSVFGAGPFLLIEKMQLDSVSHHGESCTFVHSAAFGQWGNLAIELMQIYECSPPSLAQRFFPGPMPLVNHVAFLSPEPEADSARLDEMGCRQFMHSRIGPVEARLHDATHTIGCAVEIHRQNDFIEGFFTHVRDIARGWDGRDPLRPFSG